MDCFDEETEFNEQTWLYYVDERTKHLKFDIDAWLKTGNHFNITYSSEAYENHLPCSRIFSNCLNLSSLDGSESNKTLLEDLTIGHDSLDYLELVDDPLNETYLINENGTTFQMDNDEESYVVRVKEDVSDNSMLYSKLDSAKRESKQEVHCDSQKVNKNSEESSGNKVKKEASGRLKGVIKSIPVLKGSRLPMPIHRKPISKSLTSLVGTDSKK